MKHDPRTRTVKACDVVKLLNALAAIDPIAIIALINHRVPCGGGILDHATVQAGRNAVGSPEVGMLGILNGLFGTFSDGWGCITAEISDDETKIRFSTRGRPGARRDS